MAAVNVDVDATILSRGMMFRRRKRALKARAPSSSDSGSEPVVTTRGHSDEDEAEEVAEFCEYVGRDLPFPQVPPVELGSGPTASRKGLQRVSSFLFERDEELISAVDRLGKLGDSIEGRVCKEMRQAVKSLGDDGSVDAADLDYEEYKKAAAPFLNNGKEEWMSVAKLFRFTEEVLTVNQETLEGEVDPVLEQKLEDYNSRVLVDLASAFLSRAGGLLGLVKG